MEGTNEVKKGTNKTNSGDEKDRQVRTNGDNSGNADVSSERKNKEKAPANFKTYGQQSEEVKG